MENGGTLLDIVNTPEFENAWDFVSNTSSSFKEFVKLPMPQGISAQELWGTFSKLRRIAGTTIPVNVWVNVNTNVGWICLSGRSESQLLHLRRIASSSSHYNDYIRRNSIDDYHLHSFIFPEIQSLARHDGVTIKTNTLDSAWFHSLKPSNAVEQLIVNFEVLLHKAEHFAKRRISRELMEDLYEQLCQGLPDDFVPVRNFRYEPDFYRNEIFTDPDYVDETLEQILAIFRHDTVFHDDFLRMVELTNFMWDIPLFPRFNRLIEYLVRTIYYIKIGNPILAFVPFSHATDNSERSYVSEQELFYHEVESAIESREGLDSTIQVESTISLYLDYAEDIIAAIRELEESESKMIERVAKIPTLNHRQAQFLVTAARNEHASHKIQPYQRHFDVAYATARQDLFDLVEQGYLSMRKSGKAFVFQAVPQREWPNNA